MEIYYDPYSKHLESPADRRRFLYYAKNNNVSFKIYNKPITNSIVISNPFSSSLGNIVNNANHNNLKLIFETVDSLFIEPPFSKYNVLKSIKELRINNKLINKALKNAFKIIVSNEIQKRYLLQEGFFNISVIPDYSSEYNHNISVEDFRFKECLKIGWEGMGINVKALEQLTPYAIDKNNKLILITDKYAIRYLKSKFNIYKFYEWKKFEHVENIKEVDVMLMPVFDSSWIHMAKPATRIRHYFNMGKPVIAYPSSANQIEMNKAGLGEFCAPLSLWPNLLNSLRDPKIRRDYILKILKYKKSFLDEKLIDKKWNDLLKF